jgi:glutaredoxin-related protein
MIDSPYCRGAKQLLNRYCVGQQIHIVELDQLQDGVQIKQALKELSGRLTFPNLFVDGVSLGGFDNMVEMDQQGQSFRDKLQMNGCLGNTTPE